MIFFYVQGYLARCRQRPDMFSNEQIAVIFSNIEEIYGFQRQFALELEEAVNRSAVHSTELGNVFLNNVSRVFALKQRIQKSQIRIIYIHKITYTQHRFLKYFFFFSEIRF